MSQINTEATAKLESICLDAKAIDYRGGQAILCSSDNPDAGIAPQILVPMLSKGDVCVATDFYNLGHRTADCTTDTKKMYDCPYRRTSK